MSAAALLFYFAKVTTTFSIRISGRYVDASGKEKHTEIMENRQSPTMDDLRITANLARLTLSEDELRGSLKSFSDMVSYFAAMEDAEADSESFGRPLAEARESRFMVDSKHFRPDQTQADTAPDALLALAPERDGRFFVIPNVL
ncbi:MAG: aspartyl/glutamyl-tRNA amidotransferase subunit C [Spirochaetaceae bacterium]|jgi:aspartyl-tRNA(Asn)/glutamyl-tRNA(Gln) amidotransferase subunit C|nr:aspartyl/glutamyl-tRNA amidotransferase subunit C [Spirochaetaceae bacterium]